MDDRETVERRRRHALMELVARGALKSGNYPPGMRFMMWLFPRLKPPHYGDRAIHAAVAGTLFALPVMLLLSLGLSGRDGGVWLGLALGAGAGVAFGVMMVAILAHIAGRIMLTPWEDLDHPPDGTLPEGAEDYQTVESEVIRRIARVSAGVRRLD